MKLRHPSRFLSLFPPPAFDTLPSQLSQRYGIVENPFGFSPDPSYLYRNKSHREALSSLLLGIEYGVGFQALVAPPGMGKTSLLLRVLETFENTACTAFLFEFQGGPRELLRDLLSDWGIDSRDHDITAMKVKINDLD